MNERLSMSKRSRPRWIAVAGLWLMVAGTPAAGAFVIDDFTQALDTAERENLVQSQRGSHWVRERQSLQGIIGGIRQLGVALINQGANPDAVSVWVDQTDGGLNYESSAGADGAFEITYDAGGSGLRADFYGATGVRIVIAADASAVPYQVTATFTDTGGRSAVLTRPVTTSGVQTTAFPLSDIRGINVRKVARIVFLVDPRSAGDLVVSRIETY
jgi:hypothetical protein